MEKISTDRNYADFLVEIKSRIDQSRIKAIRSINKELIKLYWHIGKAIIEKQNQFGWGKSVVELLSNDLRRMYPEVSGFSARNLWDMRRLYEEYKDYLFLRQLVAEIPWGQTS
jgi:predicted nuclease of restriction endonuclease-like (RecB) superfamily